MERGITCLVLKMVKRNVRSHVVPFDFVYLLAAWVAVYLSTKMLGCKHQEWLQTSNGPVPQPKQLSLKTFQRQDIDFSCTFKINKGQCSFRFYNEMRLNNMCNVC